VQRIPHSYLSGISGFAPFLGLRKGGSGRVFGDAEVRVDVQGVRQILLRLAQLAYGVVVGSEAAVGTVVRSHQAWAGNGAALIAPPYWHGAGSGTQAVRP